MGAAGPRGGGDRAGLSPVRRRRPEAGRGRPLAGREGPCCRGAGAARGLACLNGFSAKREKKKNKKKCPGVGDVSCWERAEQKEGLFWAACCLRASTQTVPTGVAWQNLQGDTKPFASGALTVTQV